jgi:hypothetical protein
MRLTAVIFLLCGLGAAIWAEASGRNAEVEARWPGRIAPPDIQAGVRARLTSLPGFVLSDIVIGEETADGAWSFRARALDPAWPSDPTRPVYGRAAPRCDAMRGRAACWDLATLEIDGAPIGKTGL